MKRLLNMVVLVYVLIIFAKLDCIKAEENIESKSNNEKYTVLTLKTYGALSYEMDYYPDPNEIKINYSLIGSGEYDMTFKDKNEEDGFVNFYDKKECVEKIKNNILEYFKNYYYNLSFAYNGHGVIFGAGVRYICVPESIVNENQTNGKPDVDKLFDKYQSNKKDAIIPMDVWYQDGIEDDTSLFPFDSITNGNKEESKQLMLKMDKEIKDIGSKKYKASFNCNIDKLTDVERTICNYEDLGKLDIELNNLYKQLLVKYSNNNDKKKRIIKTQKEWLEERNKLDTYYKLRDSYKKRIENLKKYS